MKPCGRPVRRLAPHNFLRFAFSFPEALITNKLGNIMYVAKVGYLGTCGVVDCECCVVCPTIVEKVEAYRCFTTRESRGVELGH